MALVAAFAGNSLTPNSGVPIERETTPSDYSERPFVTPESHLQFAPGSSAVHAVQVSAQRTISSRPDKLIIRPVRTGKFKKLGAAATIVGLGEPQYEKLLTEEFDSITTENALKMVSTQTSRGSFDFTQADRIVSFAQKHDKELIGHTLIFGESDWSLGYLRQLAKGCTNPLTRRSSAAAMRSIMRVQIETSMKRYPYIRKWHVINEVFKDNGHYNGEDKGDKNPWYPCLGPSYPIEALAIARQTDPSARLIVNEYNAEGEGKRRDALVRFTKDNGHLFDGIGIQAHLRYDDIKKASQLPQTMKTYAGLGRSVDITELDIVVPENPTDAELKSQRRINKMVVKACALEPACVNFSYWGVNDRLSWLGARHQPLPFTAGYAKKQMFNDTRRFIPGPPAHTAGRHKKLS